ncbi:lipopolysaccharide biosynthesis protein [Halanaerobium saccharolyticum]|uniref:lipopolysaccharide biosynthesis protein n=1 Tax=Halanaerobium saccharolyticum TaxID=43595 RepID=UPI003FCDDD4F
MNIKQKVRNLIGKENLEFIGHSKNYLSATFFLKALGFISVPIYTRLLTPDEYGILAVFASAIAIVKVFMGLNMRGGIKRYYFEKTDDFDQALGSNLSFIFVFDIILFSVLYLLRNEIASFFAISGELFFYASLISMLYVPFNIYLSYLQGIKNSKKYSVITIIKQVLILITSIIIMINLDKNVYMGKIYAQLLFAGILFFYAYYEMIKISVFSLKKRYIKYTLAFGIPLIPHALSGFILSHFDRIIINQLTGSLNTGLYSFAYNVGMIMNVVVMASIKAWQPIFYEEFAENNLNKINRMAYNYSKYIYLAAIGLILFSEELVMILADESYYSALNLVPIIVLGYVSVFLYTLFFQYASYRKRTGLISLNTFIAGFVNIGLNYWLIPIFGYVAAAYTTFVSYILLFVLHYSNARFVLKEDVISLRKLIPNFILTIIIGIGYMNLNNIIQSYWVLLILKICIVLICVYYFLFKE